MGIHRSSKKLVPLTLMKCQSLIFHNLSKTLRTELLVQYLNCANSLMNLKDLETKMLQENLGLQIVKFL
jgi:hypothetical protein